MMDIKNCIIRRLSVAFRADLRRSRPCWPPGHGRVIHHRRFEQHHHRVRDQRAEELGPGLLHSVYLHSLAHALLERNLQIEVERPVPLIRGALRFDKAFRADLVIDDRVIVEVKTIRKITDLDVAQMLTYLRLMNIRLGLIINFNVGLLKNGIRRVVNRYVDSQGNLR